MEAAGRLHFGELLRKFRLDAGITQQELAERAKLSVEAVSTLERGARTRPHRETVALLGRALGLSPEREALLESAGGIAHPPRRREHSETWNATLLSIVRPDAQSIPNHNLPQRLTSFVGRQRELREITDLLREHQLVTVVGSGGVGKTYVTLRLAGDLLDDYPAGVWLVDLSPLEDERLVASAVLSALRLPSTTASSIDAVIAYLRSRRILLILDNCEHVIAQAREVASSLVQACSEVRILSTSREALGVSGERVYRLPSLAVPPDSCRTAHDALPYAAVALFVDRAPAVDPSFALTDDNATDVAQICRRLDGIPLAIELAAARVKVLAPCQIAERLDQRFRLLTGGDPRALPRHRTMTALIDWSYDLLTLRERRFFESLSVFAGGCTLDSAVAVCAADGEDDLDVVDLLTSLVTKSLLVAELVGREERYRLLESSRQYARDKLTAQGDQAKVAARFALVYVELAERLERACDTTPDREWLPQAQLELENWRAVLEWALEKRSDIVLGQRLAALRNVVWRIFTLPEGRRWVRAALEAVDDTTSPLLLARLEHADASGARLTGDRRESLATAEQALVRYRELSEPLGIAQVQQLAADSLVIAGRFEEAEPLLREALKAARTLGNRRLEVNVLQSMGIARSLLGDFAGARACLTEAHALAKALGAEFFAAHIAAILSGNEYDAGDLETALRLSVDALATYRALNSPTEPGIVGALANMAMFLVAMGRYDEAQVRALEALELAEGLRMDVMAALCLRYLALAIVMRAPQTEGRRESAVHADIARLCGFINARLITLGVPEGYDLPKEYGRALAILRDAIGADEVTRLMAAGAAMSEVEAIALAHSRA